MRIVRRPVSRDRIADEIAAFNLMSQQLPPAPPKRPAHRSPSIGRRGFLLVLGGAVALMLSAVRRKLQDTQARELTSARDGAWHQRSTWRPAEVPGALDRIRIDHQVTVSGANRAGEIDIGAPGRLVFDRDARSSVTIECSRPTRGIVVRGALEMQPADRRIEHRITFAGVDEERYEGSGMDPLDTDPGLWVVDAGALVLSGAAISPWNRTGDDPSWDDSHELVVAPTGAGNVGAAGFAPFERGQKVPRVSGSLPAAEVLNLTRNVVIEGTPGGRAHVFVRNSVPVRQLVRHVVLRELGPRKGGLKVPGRWPLHFHHCGENDRGSLVEGVVVRSAGSHAFVPHASNGIRFAGCVAYDVQEAAFWWDLPTDPDDRTDSTDDVLWEDCVAAHVRPGDPRSELQLAGFVMGGGTGNVARRCVATGILGETKTSGFLWPEQGPAGSWLNVDCVAHNNIADGIYAWQNDDSPNETRGFVAYRCGVAGVEHGAYANVHHYAAPITLFECGQALLVCHATSREQAPPLSFDGAFLNGDGRTEAGLVLRSHPLPAGQSVQFRDPWIAGVTWPVVVDENEGGDPTLVDLIRPSVGRAPRPLEPRDIFLRAVNPGTRIRVLRGDGTAWQMDGTGAVEEIDPSF